jgi:hypothetical protein
VGFEPGVLAQAALVTGAVAGGAWSPAVAVTIRCALRGRYGLGERRAGKQRDERERGNKDFHDASPFIRTEVRGFPQSDGLTASAQRSPRRWGRAIIG